MKIEWHGGRVDQNDGGARLSQVLCDEYGIETTWEYPGYLHYESKRLSGYSLDIGTADGEYWAWNTTNESKLPDFDGSSKIPVDSEDFDKILNWVLGTILVFENLA